MPTLGTYKIETRSFEHPSLGAKNEQQITYYDNDGNEFLIEFYFGEVREGYVLAEDE
jgi:hypothetical protein